MGQADDEQPVLLDDRSIETEFLLKIGDLLLCRRRSQRHAGRIARNGAGDDEDHHRQSDQNQQRPQDAPQDKTKEFHGAISRASGNGAGAMFGFRTGPTVAEAGGTSANSRDGYQNPPLARLAYWQVQLYLVKS